jgi:hypothetical protein
MCSEVKDGVNVFNCIKPTVGNYQQSTAMSQFEKSTNQQEIYKKKPDRNQNNNEAMQQQHSGTANNYFIKIIRYTQSE